MSLPNNKLQLQGKKFNCLTVVREYDKFKKKIRWLCLCDCGKETVVIASNIVNGNTKSCGCLRVENLLKKIRTHGQAGIYNRTDEYKIWANIKSRCTNPKNPAYGFYGGIGIGMCGRWLNSFENFISDIGKRPTKKHSVDRFPNQKGDYEPSNCRWATIEQQSRNKRNNVWFEKDGERLIQSDWAKKLGITSTRFKQFLKSGESFDSIVDKYSVKKGKI